MLIANRSLYPWGGLRALPALACAHAWRGQVMEVEQALNTLTEPDGLFPSPDSIRQCFVEAFRLLTYLYTDRSFSVSVEELAENILSVTSSDTYSLAPLCTLIEIGDDTNTTAILDEPYTVLSQAFTNGVVFTTGWMFLIPRILGIAESRRRHWEQGKTLFLQAIETATQADAKPELARSYLDYARMLMAQDPLRHHLEATEYTKKALAIFQNLEMHPFIKRATSLIEKLQPHSQSLSLSSSVCEDQISNSSANILQNAAQEYIKFLR